MPNFCEGDGRGHNKHLHICTVRGRSRLGEDRRCLRLTPHKALKRGISIPREESDKAKSLHECDHRLGGSTDVLTHHVCSQHTDEKMRARSVAVG